MRYCVFGDVHANLEALEAMVADARRLGADRYVCVGDIVGYGADPVECVDRVQGLTTQIVAGNHDYAAVGRTELEYFNYYARDAVVWTRRQLSPTDKAFLRDLPLTLDMEELAIAHATLDRPEEFGYIESDTSARRSFDKLTKRIAFVGHSHVPVAFFYTIENKRVFYTKDVGLELDSSAKAIVNVGSVGQPRDNDPRATYALYDSSRHIVILRRLQYNIEAAAQKILDAGLPRILAQRLAVGR